MAKKSLMVWGGWDGHTPKEMTELLADGLRKRDFKVTIETDLEVFVDAEKLATYDLITPVWTCGTLSPEQCKGLTTAIHGGVGLAGVHGGMGDAFRNSLEYQWMVGGQFVGHPHVGEYEVRVTNPFCPIMQAVKPWFAYNSEQYYMLVDPGVCVLADTQYTYEDRKVTMPVVWNKMWGKGKVFYNALGHVADEFVKHPDVLEMSLRGMVWAAR